MSSKKKPLPRKVLVVGDSNTGKTNLVARMLERSDRDDHFSEFVCHTFAFDFFDLSIDGIDVQIWDCAGVDRFAAKDSIVYNSVSAAIVVYDITNRSTFNSVGKWISRLRMYKATFPILIVGNKTDIDFVRQVPLCEALQYGAAVGLLLVEASALCMQGQRHREAVLLLVNKMLMSQSVPIAKTTTTTTTPSTANPSLFPKIILGFLSRFF
jgi:small GTP-binding protein